LWHNWREIMSTIAESKKKKALNLRLAREAIDELIPLLTTKSAVAREAELHRQTLKDAYLGKRCTDGTLVKLQMLLERRNWGQKK